MKSFSIKGISKVLGIALLGLLLSFSSAAQDSLNVKKHTNAPKKFERKMKKENVQVLDVRTQKEYDEGHITGARLLDVNKPEFEEEIALLNKNITYLIYCKSGRRSEKAMKILYHAGFKNVYHVKGGYLNWRGETVQ